MHNITKIAAVVVLYNPDLGVIENLNSYIDQIDKLYAVDNSENINSIVVEKIKCIKKAEYISNGKNLGIAAALNIGAKKAIKEGFEFLLTMDQDSRATPGMILKLSGVASSSLLNGIAAARHVNIEFPMETENKVTEEVLYTITSGNLLNLAAYQKVGPFMEELFIDHVDHEYCLRMKKNGFRVLKINHAVVYHKIGNAARKKFLAWFLYTSGHSPLRLYYRTRNRFYVDSIYKKLFPEYVKEDRRNLVKELLGIFLLEKDLWSKIRMIFKGYRDFKQNILGKYQF
ncbi:MAG: glycosyltransferase family 2 protein [Ignavibacteria bacterium]